MWICTTDGFMSAVEDPKQPGVLKVRSRRKEVLQKYFRSAVIVETHHTDYRFRVFVDKKTFADLMHKLVMDIDYDNFKAATKKKDPELAHLYGDMWLQHWRYQQDDPRFPRLRGRAVPK